MVLQELSPRYTGSTVVGILAFCKFGVLAWGVVP